MPSARLGAYSAEKPDGGPLKVREFISHDSRLRFGNLNHAYVEIRNVELAGPMGGIAKYLRDLVRGRDSSSTIGICRPAETSLALRVTGALGASFGRAAQPDREDRQTAAHARRARDFSHSNAELAPTSLSS
jgi:hypothetical protein